MEEKKKINQVRFEELRSKGFPKGCLDQCYLDGIIIEKLPEEFQISHSRLSECWIQKFSADSLKLSNCVLADCILQGLSIDEMKIMDGTMDGTLLSGNTVGKMDFTGMSMRHSSMRDCAIESLVMEDTALDGMYFFRTQPKYLRGEESMRVTLGGATEEEVENYRRCVKGEIIPPKKEFKTLGDNICRKG